MATVLVYTFLPFAVIFLSDADSDSDSNDDSIPEKVSFRLIFLTKFLTAIAFTGIAVAGKRAIGNDSNGILHLQKTWRAPAILAKSVKVANVRIDLSQDYLHA